MCCQVYLNDDGSVASLVYEISCPAPEHPPDLLPAFLAELPGQNAEPGQSRASSLLQSMQLECTFA
jgi:hypothetical protein